MATEPAVRACAEKCVCSDAIVATAVEALRVCVNAGSAAWIGLNEGVFNTCWPLFSSPYASNAPADAEEHAANSGETRLVFSELRRQRAHSAPKTFLDWQLGAHAQPRRSAFDHCESKASTCTFAESPTQAATPSLNATQLST